MGATALILNALFHIAQIIIFASGSDLRLEGSTRFSYDLLLYAYSSAIILISITAFFHASPTRRFVYFFFAVTHLGLALARFYALLVDSLNIPLGLAANGLLFVLFLLAFAFER